MDINIILKQNNLNVRYFIFLLAGLLFATCTGTKEKNKHQKPNIILIVADDLGYDDLSIHGNTLIETPCLDQLGEQSVRFENFHVASVCAPTRASLLTGRNFLRTGVSGVHAGRDFVNLHETMLPEVFQQNGYKTGMWGKWHSGKANGYFPWDRGFDEAYYSLLYNYWDNTGLLNGEHVQTSGFTTDAITDMAIEFIENKKDETFFAYIPHLAPHSPWRAPEKYINKYINKGLSKPMATLYGMIDNLDFNIGRVIDKVEELEIAENTIIVFMSDNGPNRNSYRFGLTQEEWKLRNVNGRRGAKGQNWENGIISPLFIYYPNKFNPHRVTTFSKAEDLFPTLLELAGISVPNDLKLDGQSLVPALNEKALPQAPVYVSHFSPVGAPEFSNKLDKYSNNIPFTDAFKASFKTENQRLALLKEPYKLMQHGANNSELFDIVDNPKENSELTIKDDSVTAEMQNELHQWYEKIKEEPSFNMPTFQIGFKNRAFSQIFAYAPIETASNIMNMNLYSGNWTNKGDYAKYKIKVHVPGEYELMLVQKIADYAKIKMKVESNNKHTEAWLSDSGNRDFGTILQGESAYWEDFDSIATFKTDIIKSNLGVIELLPSDSILTISIEELAQGHKGSIADQLISLQLIKK
ncbi:arylsulfatase [Bacteroidales bacterium]|nr:arylsulfatase [Bacteroidales bacterium]